MEVMAFLARATPKDGATYTKKASRARLSGSGLAKVWGSKPEHNVSNLAKKLDT